MKETLRLKWGTLKAWNFNEGSPAFEALQRYASLGPTVKSAALQEDTDEQKLAICDIIDALDNTEIYLDWDGKYVDKEAAKKYVMEYGKD